MLEEIIQTLQIAYSNPGIPIITGIIGVMAGTSILLKAYCGKSAKYFLRDVVSEDENYLLEASNTPYYERDQDMGEEVERIRLRYEEVTPSLAVKIKGAKQSENYLNQVRNTFRKMEDIESTYNPKATHFRLRLNGQFGSWHERFASKKYRTEMEWRRNIILQMLDEYDSGNPEFAEKE